MGNPEMQAMGCLSKNRLFIVCLLSVGLAAFSSEAACLEIAHSLSFHCLAVCLLVGSCLSGNRFFLVCLAACQLGGGCLYKNYVFIVRSLPVWLAACSAETACLEIAHSLSVVYQLLTFCLSSWLPAHRRLRVWELIIYCLFILCLAGCLLVGGCLCGDCLSTVCLLLV